MKKITLLLSLSFLMIVPAFSQIGTIKGIILNAQGEPLPNVSIVFTVEDNSEFKQEITSKDDGKFLLTGLKPGKIYTITCNLEGYNTQVLTYKQWIGPNPGGKDSEITMYTLEEAYEMQGGNLESLAADQAARELYNTAVGFFQQKKYEESLDPIKKAYESYAKIEDDDELKAELVVIPRLYGIIAYNNGEYETAKTMAEEYLKAKPDDKNITDLLAAAVKKLSGPSPTELYNQAIELINKSDDAGAAKLLEQAIKTDPQYGLPYFQLGKIKTREFEFEEAVKYFKLFVKVDPKNKLADEAKELIVTLSE